MAIYFPRMPHLIFYVMCHVLLSKNYYAPVKTEETTVKLFFQQYNSRDITVFER